jgi:hypothetical protein
MALPVLYWMLECPRCRSRRVVRDTYLEWLGGTGPPGSGYGGRPLPARYPCPEGCDREPRVIGSIFKVGDEEMMVAESRRKKMNERLRKEWTTLIRKAGLDGAT